MILQHIKILHATPRSDLVTNNIFLKPSTDKNKINFKILAESELLCKELQRKLEMTAATCFPFFLISFWD